MRPMSQILSSMPAQTEDYIAALLDGRWEDGQKRWILRLAATIGSQYFDLAQ